MAKVSIIGAGQAGLIFAYTLLRGGHDVTVYSDRTPEQWLNDFPPTGTAFLYGDTIDIERDLGIDHWSQDMFSGSGVLLDFKPRIEGDDHVVVSGRFGSEGGAIDQRLRIHRWLEDMEAAGGRLVIESVSPERLDAIALSSDLTVLAAGKADLARIIPRHAQRSVYDRPQRNLAMAIAQDVKGFGNRVDFVPVKFNFYGDAGEFFWVPYTHKTAGPTWCVLFEARPDGPLDKFGDCASGEQVIDVARTLIREHAPWEYEAFADMRFVEHDPHGWLKGRFAPTVREAYGRLPSGGLVMPLGDTSVTFDPIGGQGGNHASRNASYLAGQVIEQDKRSLPFTADWMTDVNDRWWEENARWAYDFNNMLLEPLTEAGTAILMAAARSRDFADAHFFGNFPQPKRFFPFMANASAARELIDGFRAKAQA